MRGSRYRISGTVSQADVSAGFFTAIPLYLDFGALGTQKQAIAQVTGPATQNITVSWPWLSGRGAPRDDHL